MNQQYPKDMPVHIYSARSKTGIFKTLTKIRKEFTHLFEARPDLDVICITGFDGKHRSHFKTERLKHPVEKY